MKQNPQSARDTNKTIERNKILRLREILMKQLMSLNHHNIATTTPLNETDSTDCAGYWRGN